MTKPREKKSLRNGQLPTDGLGLWVQVGQAPPLYVAVAGVPLYQREMALNQAYSAVIAGLRERELLPTLLANRLDEGVN